MSSKHEISGDNQMISDENSIFRSKEEQKVSKRPKMSESEESDVDDEWTYTAPQYYNVKNASVKALDSYKYITKYKHNRRSGRTVRYFLWQYPECDKKFNKSWNFIDHMRMHNGEKPYQCSHCGKQFTQKGNFNKHWRIHASE